MGGLLSFFYHLGCPPGLAPGGRIGKQPLHPIKVAHADQRLVAALNQLAVPGVVPGVNGPGKDQPHRPGTHLPASLSVVALDPAELGHGG